MDRSLLLNYYGYHGKTAHVEGLTLIHTFHFGFLPPTPRVDVIEPVKINPHVAPRFQLFFEGHCLYDEPFLIPYHSNKLVIKSGAPGLIQVRLKLFEIPV